ESLQKLRCRDAAGVTPFADVLDVRRLAVDLAVISLAERHTPERLLYRLAGSREPGRKLVVVAEHPGILMTERHHDGARERREIDHELRLETILAVPERVGQNEPAFRIRVEHLDRLPGKAVHDVARPLRVAAGHV